MLASKSFTNNKFMKKNVNALVNRGQLKLIKVMKTTILLIFVFTVQTFAGSYAQSTKLNLSMKDVTFKDFIAHVEAETEFYFMLKYDEGILDKHIDLQYKNAQISEILDDILANTGYGYKIIDRYIAISKTTKSSGTQQQKIVSGKVTDPSGTPLPGVTVVVKGTTSGTVTNIDGEYTLANIPGNATLQFSFVGMKTQEVLVGSQAEINVSMEEDAIGVKEVVVTALGISREKKQLTYSIQDVEGEQLSSTGNYDVTKSLQGKIAGVTVRQVSGLPGQEAKVTIRGSSSISGNNTPLYVVDGSPVHSGVYLNMNPNEIENVSILKGATAAALYGLRASAGVVLITTKKGKGNAKNKPTVTFTSNYTFDRMAIYPDMQMEYGQGSGGNYSAYTSLSYGPKISEWGTYTNQLGEQEAAAAYNNIKNVFQTGYTNDNHLNLSNRFEKGNYSIGFGYTGQKGIVPHTKYNKKTINLASEYELFKNLTFSTVINYALTEANPNATNSIFWGLINCPASYDMANKPTHRDDNEYYQINFRSQHDNPLWSLEHNYINTDVSSFFTSPSLNYKPAKWLNLNYKVGFEDTSTDKKTVYELGSALASGRTDPPSGGKIIESRANIKTLNSIFLATIKYNISDKLDFEFLAGHEYYNYESNSLSTTGTDFTVGGFHNISNCSTITSSQSLSRYRSYALFGNLNVNYGRILNLTLSLRDDVVSSMPRDSRSFVYPSVGLGFAFSELIGEKPDFFEFGRVRASYAEVGQAGDIYATSNVYSVSGGSYFSFPYNGINAYTQSSTLKSTSLQPENTKSWELGANLIFFGNRINLDYTYYDILSEGQIFSVPISTATGYSSEKRNAGVMTNKGHEVQLSIKPIMTTDITWDLTTNFTAYANKVKELAEGVDELVLGSNSDCGYSVAKAGNPYPILRGYGFVRDEDTGKIVVESDPASTTYGTPLRSSSSDIIFGKANPDFEINFMTTFRYKNLSLYAQVDWRQGGVIVSGETRLARVYGTAQETADGRYDDFVYPNAVKGTYVGDELVIEGENDIHFSERLYSNYWSKMDKIWENNVFDASFVRLREVRLNYDVPRNILSKCHIGGASVYLIGRNLWLIYSGLPNFDPEMSIGTGNAQGLTSNQMTYPQIRNIGFGIELTF